MRLRVFSSHTLVIESFINENSILKFVPVQQNNSNYSIFVLLQEPNSNTFFSFEFNSEMNASVINTQTNEMNVKPTSLAIPENITIGYNCSVAKLDNQRLIVCGGIDDRNVNIFNFITDGWTHVDEMENARIGAHVLMNESSQSAYISGGLTGDLDNTTEVEQFSLTFDPIFEVKQLKIKDSYLLRKSYGAVIPLYLDNTYLIVGGRGLFDDSDTTTVLEMNQDNVYLSSVTAPKPFSVSSQHTEEYKNCFYFFVSDAEVICFSVTDKQFSLIVR